MRPVRSCTCTGIPPSVAKIVPWTQSHSCPSTSMHPSSVPSRVPGCPRRALTGYRGWNWCLGKLCGVKVGSENGEYRRGETARVPLIAPVILPRANESTAFFETDRRPPRKLLLQLQYPQFAKIDVTFLPVWPCSPVPRGTAGAAVQVASLASSLLGWEGRRKIHTSGPLATNPTTSLAGSVVTDSSVPSGRNRLIRPSYVNRYKY
jgi:hypothetical protein